MLTPRCYVARFSHLLVSLATDLISTFDYYCNLRAYMYRYRAAEIMCLLKRGRIVSSEWKFDGWHSTVHRW